VHAAALKRAVALKVNDLIETTKDEQERDGSRMRTSRAAVHRLLDPGEHLSHARNIEPRREIARAQTKNRIGAGRSAIRIVSRLRCMNLNERPTQIPRLSGASPQNRAG